MIQWKCIFSNTVQLESNGLVGVKRDRQIPNEIHLLCGLMLKYFDLDELHVIFKLVQLSFATQNFVRPFIMILFISIINTSGLLTFKTLMCNVL